MRELPKGCVEHLDGLGPWWVEGTSINPTKSEIAAFESRTGVQLPKEYVSFLVRYGYASFRVPLVVPAAQPCAASNAHGYVCVEAFFGIPRDPSLSDPNDDLDANYEDYQGRLLEKTLPIARDGVGNVILIGTEQPFKGQVFFWSPATGDCCFISPTFAEFLMALRPDPSYREGL